jgi:hypothetical protein
MSTTYLQSPTSRVRWGYARADITPPVGIYHRFWGAASHDRATGVHSPLFGDLIVLGPAGHTAPALVRAHLDLVNLPLHQHDELQSALSEASGVPIEQTVISYSHTHASGWFSPERQRLPGGDLIPAYLDAMRSRLMQAAGQAAASMQPATITYACGHCNMAANRDFWDEANGCFVCGLNPDGAADDTTLVARVTGQAGIVLAVLVNYGCHATTLAYENTLISPDFAGALRETVTRLTGAPCIFAQGACGDLGPRYDYIGGPAVAEQNGRWLAYAALAALESMGPPGVDYQYQGPVVSGATLGVWDHVPPSAEHAAQVSRFDGGAHTVDLPLRPKPDAQRLQQELEQRLADQAEAEARGDMVRARDCGAQAERARRWLARLDTLPEGGTYPFHYSVHRLGDAVWVTCGGEPYSRLQVELRSRFPNRAILLSPISGDHAVGYLLPRDRYGLGLYQEEPSILAPGCLEQLIEAVAERIAALLEG